MIFFPTPKCSICSQPKTRQLLNFKIKIWKVPFVFWWRLITNGYEIQRWTWESEWWSTYSLLLIAIRLIFTKPNELVRHSIAQRPHKRNDDFTVMFYCMLMSAFCLVHTWNRSPFRVMTLTHVWRVEKNDKSDWGLVLFLVPKWSCAHFCGKTFLFMLIYMKLEVEKQQQNAKQIACLKSIPLKEWEHSIFSMGQFGTDYWTMMTQSIVSFSSLQNQWNSSLWTCKQCGWYFYFIVAFE